MKRADREATYTSFVVSRQDHLRRIAYALCGDWNDADDLLQIALTRLYTAWSRIGDDGNPEAYVRTILMRTNIDAYRLRGRRVRTTRLDAVGDHAARAGLPPDERNALIEAVQQLPEMQRKVVVLRHWLGLTVQETARDLGISEGTVKSHSSRGLTTLRARLELESDEDDQPFGHHNPSDKQHRDQGRAPGGPVAASRGRH